MCHWIIILGLSTLDRADQILTYQFYKYLILWSDLRIPEVVSIILRNELEYKYSDIFELYKYTPLFQRFLGLPW